MECKYFKELISADIDGYLSEKDKLKLKDHISHCKNCKSYLEELEKSLGILRSLEKMEAPASFEKKVIEKIKDKEKAPFFFFNKKLLFEFSVAIFALASILFVYLNLTQKKAEEIPEILGEEKIVETIKSKEDLEKKDTGLPEIKEEKKIFVERKKQEELKKRKSMIVPDIVPQSPDEGAQKEFEELKPEKKLENEKFQEKLERTKEKKEKFQLKAPLPTEVTKKVKNEEIVMVVGEGLVVDKIEKKIKIKAKAENLESFILKIEEILKEEKIQYQKIILKETLFEIDINVKNLRNLLEKISNLDGIKAEEYDLKDFDGTKKIKLEISVE